MDLGCLRPARGPAGNEMLSAFERTVNERFDVIRRQFPVGHVELGARWPTAATMDALLSAPERDR